MSNSAAQLSRPDLGGGSRRWSWAAPAAGPTPLRPLVWATAAYLGGLLLNADRIPRSILFEALILVAWRLASAAPQTRIVRIPRPAIRNFIALFLVGAVTLMFRTLNGLSAGTSLLVLMGACKMLETRGRRDQFIVVGTSLFLLLAACLDRQNFVRLPLYLLQAWLCCAAMAVISSYPAASRAGGSRTAFDDRKAILLAGRTLLFALPFALALFVFFPRLPGAFWQLSRGDEATTGLGDTMSPGSITQLTSSYEIAFRVHFQGERPPTETLYWRGPVLHQFDGFTWRRNPTFYLQRPLKYSGPSYLYRISVEPSSQRWLFSLDTLERRPAGKFSFTDDYELLSQDPITQTTTYTALSSTTTLATEPLPNYARHRDTQPLPPHNNERTVEFARELRARSASDQAYADAVLDFFRKQGFEYTLTPPALGPNSIDDFLFRTRQGFCGHFASAFVTLMRAAGIPAHVVTGYLGGEWNPVGDYYIVRQSDAHAWAEIWLDGRGWTRVDPTAVVAPERLRRGILDLLPNAVSASARLVSHSTMLTSIVQRWDAFNTWWNDKVVKFNLADQLGLLEWFGIDSPDLSDLGWGFAAGFLGWLIWIAWQFGRSAPTLGPDRLGRAYRKLCSKLARAGAPREPHQGPLAFADFVAQRRPDLAASVRALLEMYARLRFGRDSLESGEVPGSGRAVREFEQRVKNLNVSRARPRAPETLPST
jgi:protein-glutamine gamma-glutamyltransferase